MPFTDHVEALEEDKAVLAHPQAQESDGAGGEDPG